MCGVVGLSASLSAAAVSNLLRSVTTVSGSCGRRQLKTARHEIKDNKLPETCHCLKRRLKGESKLTGLVCR